MRKNADGTVTVKIRETGQVLDMVPDVASAMLASKYAVQPESAMAEPIAERADAPAQAGASKKPFFARRRK